MYLIVCPTRLEASILLEKSVRQESDLEIYSLVRLGENIELLISGIGIHQTTYTLTKALARKKYNLVIHIGIAGSFDLNMDLGTVVNIASETFGDLGIERENGFTTIFDLGLANENDFPFTNGKMVNNTPLPEFLEEIPSVQGLTVNSLATDDQKNQFRCEYFDIDVESMEGAAVFYTCLMEKVDFVEIRALSNYMGERDKNQWVIEEAIEELNEFIVDLVIS